MDAFAPIAPDWTKPAVHAFDFRCPQCRASSRQAEKVWLNRRAPVYTADYTRKWQEFYHCSCGCVWWAWSSDRPPELEAAEFVSEITLPDGSPESPNTEHGDENGDEP